MWVLTCLAYDSCGKVDGRMERAVTTIKGHSWDIIRANH